MSSRGRFDAIRDAVVNGQRRQALEFMAQLDGDERANMLDYFVEDLGDCFLALDAAKVWLRLEYKLGADV